MTIIEQSRDNAPRLTGGAYTPMPYRFGEICDVCWLVACDIIGVDHPDHDEACPRLTSHQLAHKLTARQINLIDVAPS